MQSNASLFQVAGFFTYVDITSSSVITQTLDAVESHNQQMTQVVLFLGGTLHYRAVCPLCTWMAQLGSLPVL